ncbi:MAG: hypothetical protein KKI02_03500, partial [Planctomycetes bacterium]|nr:hypothetical protein [Planctomycetota bacterium]
PLVSPRDPPALAREMERMACDAELRRKVGERLRQRFNVEYSLDRLAERIGPIYERILGSPETRPNEESRTTAVAAGVEPTPRVAGEDLEAPPKAARPGVPTPV